ncbi:MAG: glycosyl hydrolase [Gemmatimonadetes bacterium]|nr:glycosyl hydrolase [Gemmatimonadota bacterium]NNM04941.1 glycosyl hydrolase [Gemmatimonadota bacterium]
MRIRPPTILLAIMALGMAGPIAAQEGPTLDDTWMEAFQWRSIGPANMSGRVTDIEGLSSPSKTFYVAAAAGGIWKTTNNGTTFRPLFQTERVAAMGDLAIAPSDSMQIWAGTGEEDSRNSISPGSGIYKSTDGGLTWELKGLEATEHIGRIVVHPDDPNTVWVAALGALWRSNPERGLYKTTDGGETWELVNFVSDKAGFVDVAIHPKDPDVLLAASWERERGPYYLQSGGPGSALWKSTDGGDSWERVEGGGLPEGELGRIGIAFAPSYPQVVYLMVEANPVENADGEEERTSGLYRSQDGGETWEFINPFNTRPFYYSEVKVDPMDPDRVYFSSLRFSTDGGRTAATAGQGVHVDYHAIWIDPLDPERIVLGNDGGIAVSFDQGGNYIFPNTFPIGQFYAVSYDMAVPYNVCGGLQDNYSWCGPSRKARGAITNHDWFSVSGGDGFVTQQDPRNPDIVYTESQGGNMGRSNLATGERQAFGRPNWRDSYREIQDSIAMLWPDSTQAMPSQHATRIAELQARASADSASLQLRFNWNTPFFLSPHDPDVVYAGSNRVLKSTNQGDDLVAISPDLSKQDEEKIRISTSTTGGITVDNTGAETFATIVSLAESFVQAELLYAGTDDGNLWVSPDDGDTWNDITANLDGLVPDGTYVSRIEPSHHDAGRVYVTFDNHRRGDFTPYVVVSEDMGESFRSISSNLPTGKPDFAHVIREDHKNADLLFVGTDVGAYISLNRGDSWQKFMNGLPTTPVHDLQIHPRDGDLIAGTHGRSIWIVNITPLQQVTASVMASNAHLFEPAPAFHFGTRPTGGEFTAQLYFQAGSPPSGAQIRYWLGEAPEEDVEFQITDSDGNEVRTLNGSKRVGLNTATWNLRGQSVPIPRSPSEVRDSIAVDKRLTFVVDSLAEAGEDREELDRIAEQLRRPSFTQTRGGFGGGGGAAISGEFVERPAEGRAIAGGGGFGGGGELSLQQRITQLVRGSQGGRGRRFGGGGGLFPSRSEPAPMVEAGTYTVTMKIGDRTFTHPLVVGRAASAPSR